MIIANPLSCVYGFSFQVSDNWYAVTNQARTLLRKKFLGKKTCEPAVGSVEHCLRRVQYDFFCVRETGEVMLLTERNKKEQRVLLFTDADAVIACEILRDDIRSAIQQLQNCLRMSKPLVKRAKELAAQIASADIQ